MGVNKKDGEKGLHVHYLGGLKKCKVNAPYLHQRLGIDGGN